MPILNLGQLKQDLLRDEGLRLKPYRDSVGKLTLGCGRKLDDVGITEAEAEYLLANDITKVCNDLDHYLPWWRSLTEPQQRALANMGFNLGIRNLLGFKNMPSALQSGDYTRASQEAKNSIWAQQVGMRADRICNAFIAG